MKNIAIVLAAGNATRCGGDKLFETGVLEQTLQVFEDCDVVDEIILVIPSRQVSRIKYFKSAFLKLESVVSGGGERYFSFLNAIDFLNNERTQNCRVLVHNGANPFVTSAEISEGVDLAQKHKNVIFGYYSPNSIKQVLDDKVVTFLDREEIFETQTPQISDLDTFDRAIKAFEKNSSGKLPKDEAELLALIDEELFVYACSTRNQKITFVHDLDQRLVVAENKGGGLRMGMGEDSHRFTSVFNSLKPLTLGGVVFSEESLSVEANSDGDVIFHALTNAVLASVGEKTLCTFSDDMCREGITDSWAYLENALALVTAKFPNFKIQNVNISLEAQKPRIAPYHDRIQNHIAELLKLAKSQVGLTYTSGEALSEVGKGKGIRCLVYLLVLI